MSETEQEEREEQPSPIINIPIEWPVPESIQSQYASAVFVQAGPYELAISFFETRPPILTGTPEENKAKLKEMGSIRAECVSKIILSPEVLPGFISALQTELEKYQSHRLNQ